LQLYGRGTFRERAIGALEKEGVDMPSGFMGWFALLSLRFRVEKETPFLKALKASLFCLKNLPMTAAIRFQLRSVGTMQIWWELLPVTKSEWLTTPTV
jgi:hypothetical protein